MTSFFVHRSNSLEVLAELLAKELSLPGDPMVPETIVVQSAGMQRWIAMRLAHSHGICAHMHFPFPVAFAYDLCRRLCPDLPQEYPMSQGRMLWPIVEQLQNLPADENFKSLKAYVQHNSLLQSIQLAQRIAYHFDQYLIFRPPWSQAWEQGLASGDFKDPRLQNHEAWQSMFWRKLTQVMGHEHRAALMGQTINLLQQNSIKTSWPPRVSVFGIPTLPPIYIQLLQALSPHIPVHIFLLSPCKEYWGDLITSRTRHRLYRHQNFSLEERPEDRTPLAGLGTVGQEFLELLLDHEVQDREYYIQPNTTQILGQLQDDLLNLHINSRPQNFEDRSIEVHCCHSPWREMEVLKDLLLGLLAADSTLKPQDILVMNPDIETYAPIIQAVFGQDQELPFSIADRKPTRAAEAMGLFLELLELGLHRFEVSRVWALLETGLMRQQLGLDAHQIQQLLDWLQAAGIRWGLDASFRDQWKLGHYAQNTWTSGLSRLFLGYMLGESQPLQDIAPIPLTSTAEQELLATLTAWIDDLSQLWTAVHKGQTSQEWRQTMLWMVDTFFPQNQSIAPSLLTLRRVITELTENMDQFKADLPTMLYLLRQALDESGQESGFLASGLTFCGLHPMRSIPFRIICLTGLTHSAFPRQSFVPGFDLMAASPRPGDRSLREDDRYLFLESIISARDKLILTYPGLSPRHSSEAPPSVLVAELLDFLDAHYLVNHQQPSTALVFRHKLQAFHPDYFIPDSEIFSYSKQNKDAAQALFQKQDIVPFFSPSSPDAQPKARQEISLSSLIRFFSHPCRYLLQANKIYPVTEEVLLQDEEPLTELKGLEAYTTMQALLDLALTHPEYNIHELLKSWQVLPPGQAGHNLSQKLSLEIQKLSKSIRAITQNIPGQLMPIDLDLGDYRLLGQVNLYNQHLLTYRMATTKGSDLLGLWVLYLSTLSAGHGVQAQHLGTDSSPILSPTPDPSSTLNTLLELFKKGQAYPLSFFPRASWEFAQARFQGNQTREQALQKALSTWQSNSAYHHSEKNDPYLSFLYQDLDPDWDDFVLVTEKIYSPIFRAQS